MKTLFSFILITLALNTYSQKVSPYDNIQLHTASDFRKAEPHVILASELVLSLPIEKENINRNNAISFIMKWMSGTSDYSFMMDETLVKVTGNDRDLIGVYCACISKYAIEKGKGYDRDSLKLNAYILLARYCENPNNKYKVRGEIKKLIDAKNENKVKEYLDSKQKK